MQVRKLAGVALAVGGCFAAATWAQDPPAETKNETTETAQASAGEAAAAATVAPAAPAEAATMSGAPAAAPMQDAVAPAAPEAAAAPKAVEPAEPLFSAPKALETYIGRIEGKEDPIAIFSAVQLRWAMRSKATATGGVFRKHKSSKEIFAPLDREVLERVLVALEADLEARFEAAGWQATTRAEMGGDLPQLKTLANNAELGVPLFKYNDTVNAQDFAVIALPGAQPADPKAISNGMAIMKFLKGKAGISFNIVYSFAPGTVAETDSRQLGTEATSGLWFSARADLNGAKGGWGNINVPPAGLVVDGDIGELAEIAGSKAGTAENVLRFVGGLGGSDRTGYTMTPDWAATEAAMLRAGRAFNAELVARLAK
ncbi:hypothetical protein [Arenimonas sp. MALMAid1274]|uniref:hypothetical protein n=1 Tax=Arenimonas sp. MALMAid1274 TaxID=3411630 RepID=UPI003BA07F28